MASAQHRYGAINSAKATELALEAVACHVNLLTAGSYGDHGDIHAAVARMRRDIRPLAILSRSAAIAVSLMAVIDSRDDDTLDPERVAQRLTRIRQSIRALRLPAAG